MLIYSITPTKTGVAAGQEEQVGAHAMITSLLNEQVQRQGGQVVRNGISLGRLLLIDDFQITFTGITGFSTDAFVASFYMIVGYSITVTAGCTGDPHQMPFGIA